MPGDYPQRRRDMAPFGKPWYEQPRPAGFVQARKCQGVGHYQKER